MWPHLAFFAEAFNDLSSDRPLGAMGGAGPIPWTAIDRYADRHGLDDPDVFDEFRRLIRAQDRVYLDDVAEKMKAASK